MKSYVCNAIAALALVASAGVAAAAAGTAGLAAGTDGLTGAQHQEIWQGVSKQAVKESWPTGFKAMIGEVVPSSIKLQPAPKSVSNQVPAVKSYDFAILGNQVLIVDPSSKKVIDIVTG